MQSRSTEVLKIRNSPIQIWVLRKKEGGAGKRMSPEGKEWDAARPEVCEGHIAIGRVLLGEQCCPGQGPGGLCGQVMRSPPAVLAMPSRRALRAACRSDT